MAAFATRIAGDDLLQGEGEAGGDGAKGGGEAGRVVEPDRDDAEDEVEGDGEADALATPETGAFIGVVAPDEAHEAPHQAAQQEQDDQHGYFYSCRADPWRIEDCDASA